MNKVLKGICYSSLILIIATILLVTSFSRVFVSNASTSAKGMCVMETSSHRVFYSKNMNQRLPMASTTKIMTAITAIESGMDLDEVFEISPKAIGISGTSIYLRKGEKFTLRELLYGLMLVSGNDASVAIGEHVGNGVEYFVDMMNWKAKEIGAVNTHFENTHGLDIEGHYTTAYDLALITSYALENDTFREIVSTKYKQIESPEGKTRYFKNKNKLLNTLDGTIGVKTGFTDDAGRCLVSAVERDGMRVVCVVLNCSPMFQESADLLNLAFSEYKMYDLTENYNYKNSILVTSGRNDSVDILTKEKFLYPLKEGELENIRYSYIIKDSIEAPIKKGDEVGEIRIFMNKDLLFSEKIYTIEDVKAKGVIDKFFDIITQW